MEMTLNAHADAPRDAAIAAVATATTVSSSVPDTACTAGEAAGDAAGAEDTEAGFFERDKATALNTYKIAMMMIRTRNTTAMPIPAIFNPYTRRSPSDASGDKFGYPLENLSAVCATDSPFSATEPSFVSASALKDEQSRAASKRTNSDTVKTRKNGFLFVPESLRLKLTHPFPSVECFQPYFHLIIIEQNRKKINRKTEFRKNLYFPFVRPRSFDRILVDIHNRSGRRTKTERKIRSVLQKSYQMSSSYAMTTVSISASIVERMLSSLEVISELPSFARFPNIFRIWPKLYT